MKKNYSFLIIEDHPIISDSYMSALDTVKFNNENLNFEKIGVAKNCDEAYSAIKKAEKANGVDIIFLDIQIPPSSDGKIISGADLGLIIRKKLPGTKIIVCTMFNDNYRIFNIRKSIHPEGFLVKNDLNSAIMAEAIEKILSSPPYYSPTVMSSIQKQYIHREEVDEHDRRMMYELSRGVKMKDLPDIIPMSMAGLEKRKRHLKVIFNVAQKADRFLILVAKEKGFI